MLKPVFHSYPDIRKIVEEYRESCGLEEQIPVNVEKLVDVILKINIIPIPSLYRSHEINAFISNDFKKIYVDEYLYINLESQYRFTLAHELGHMVLHGSFYRPQRIPPCLLRPYQTEVKKACKLYLNWEWRNRSI